jgi:release factor H-coupled RctB family protein
MSFLQTSSAPVKFVSGEGAWLEGGAVRQLENLAKYPGALLAVGLPDLHGGRVPIGLALVTKDFIYPYIVGNDIGCGVGLWATDLPLKKFKLDKFEKLLNSLDYLPQVDLGPKAAACPIADLGSIGGGNHFLEFQKVEAILDPLACAALDLDPDKVYLLVHTGSRGFGQSVLNEFNRETGYQTTEELAQGYFGQHDLALEWAFLNRKAAVLRILAAFEVQSSPRLVLDLPHNYLEKRDDWYIHRKGAVSTLKGTVAIPGSRGSLTYLVNPNPNSEDFAFSISHGAGRKWGRSMCRGRLSQKGSLARLKRTALNSRVVCHDLELLCQEAPEAYKNIDTVIDHLSRANLITVIAKFRPLLTWKN